MAQESGALKNPIKILLVPGHDNEYSGAQYGDRREADMTLRLATKIFNILKKDKNFDVHITRDKYGYTKEFSYYFAKNKAQIVSFKENAKKNMKESIKAGSFIPKNNVFHVSVNKNIAFRLYGINKWVDENKMDIVLHIHFNDYPHLFSILNGKYDGFAVYYPDAYFSNSKNSFALASSIFNKLKESFNTSNYTREKGGLISDQKLIALGANNTLDANVNSVLVEYGYIYEKKFRKNKTREEAYSNMTDLTIQGIKYYFNVN